MSLDTRQAGNPQAQPAPENPASPAISGDTPLKNRKHEVFVAYVLRGTPIPEAYGKAGFKTSRGNAQRLARQPDVAARIAYLSEEAAKATVYDAAWIKDRLARHATVLTEVIEVDDGKGGTLKKPGPLFNASAGARALELLGKEAGLFKDKIELGGKVQVENLTLLHKLTADERAAMRKMLVEAASRDATVTIDGVVNEPEEQGVVPPDR